MDKTTSIDKNVKHHFDNNTKSLDFLQDLITTYTNKISDIDNEQVMKTYTDARSLSQWFSSLHNLTNTKATSFSVLNLVRRIMTFFHDEIHKKKLNIKYGQGEKLRALSVIHEIRDILIIICQGIIRDSQENDTIIVSCKREATTVILEIAIPTLANQGISKNIFRMSKNLFEKKYHKEAIYLDMVRYYCNKNKIHIAINSDENDKIIELKTYLNVEEKQT